MRKTLAVATIIAIGIGGLVGAAAFFTIKPLDNRGIAPRDLRPFWTEVNWPFPIDQWGTGKAFHCEAADCGAEVTLYLRAKIGFCNCTTGVADDEELDRVGDVALFSSSHSVTGPGQPIAVAWMKGRSRPYLIRDSFFSRKSALAIAFNDRCDVIVATAVVGHNRPTSLEQTVIEFLNGDLVLRWAESTLGL